MRGVVVLRPAGAGRRSKSPDPDHVIASRLANDDKVADLELGITLNTLLVYSIVTYVSLGTFSDSHHFSRSL